MGGWMGVKAAVLRIAYSNRKCNFKCYFNSISITRIFYLTFAVQADFFSDMWIHFERYFIILLLLVAASGNN